VPALTISFRRAEMTGFWILTAAIISLVLGLSAAAFGAPMPLVWGAAGLCSLLPGLVWPQWFELGVRAWNKGVRLTAAVLRGYVLRVGYCLLFGAVSRTGSSLEIALGTPGLSRWIPRSRSDRAFDDRGPLAAADEWWGHGLLTFARRPGRGWVVCLLPVVLLLIVLGDEGQESGPPSGTYTLY
jgi:hypothetical protein